MDIEWWQRVQRYFERAMELSPGEREHYLSLVCDNDAAMLEEIRRLLAAAQAAQQQDFLDKPPDIHTFAEGEVVNRYRIQARIGKGSMGEVYLGEHPQHGEVAIKCLPALLGNNPAIRQRFQHSARLAMQLSHCGICQIHDMGETADAVHYLVMQHCPGGTLERRMGDLQNDIEAILRIGRQLLGALAEAHAHSILHRDIKPANIMFTGKDDTKIVDFGLAKDTLTRITLTGTRLGTPAYMAPEQWSGDAVDPRTDLWAVGVVLYELTTGEQPFKGETPADMMRAIQDTDPPAITALNTNAPKPLARIIDTALQKDKHLRFASAADFLQALERV